MEMESESARPKRKRKLQILPLKELVNLNHVNIIKFSPCTSLVALVSGSSARVMKLNYGTKESEEVSLYCSDFVIEDIKWSPDSQSLLLMSLADCHFVSVRYAYSEDIFRVQNPKSVQLMSVDWTPDCQHLISISAHNMYTFIHSLVDGRRLAVPVIFCSGTSHQPLMTFSCNGQYLAFVHHVNCAFHIILMSTSSWGVLWNKKTELFMVQGLEWSSDFALLAVWDSMKRILFLNLNGEPAHTVHYSDSSVTKFFSTSFAPGNDLFVASICAEQDSKIIVYNLLTWSLSAILDNEFKDEDLRALSGNSCFPIAINDSDFILGNSALSVKSELHFSKCGNFLASSLKKGLVSIWSIRNGCKLFQLFQFNNYFAGLHWHPSKAILALSVANSIVLWKSPQDDPIPKQATISSFKSSIPYPTNILWIRKNLILLSPENLKAVILIISKEKQTGVEEH